MDIGIRAARLQDARAIVELLNPLIAAGGHTAMDEPLTLDGQLAFMRGLSARGLFHVATCGDERDLVGLQDVVPSHPLASRLGSIGDISTFVAAKSHRSGIGRALSRATFLAATELGFEKLRATIRADNAAAVAFYVSQGFDVVRTLRRQVLVRGQRLDVIVAEKILGRAG